MVTKLFIRTRLSIRAICSAIFISVILQTGPVISQTEAVDDETCLDCHDDQEAVFESGVHRLTTLGGSETIGLQCASCHQGGAVHIEDPTSENIENPRDMNGLAARRACAACHQPHLALDNFGIDVHSELQVNCASCHKVHSTEPRLLLNSSAEFCTSCHAGVKSAFTRSSSHPVMQRSVTCISCHRFVKRPDEQVRMDQVRTCQSCHPDQSGPYPYEHAAANAYMVEGGGCVECHEPHGSENDKLLRQPNEGLCRQCHVTPPGHLNLPALHGFIRDIQNCVACHSEIHGSFVSTRFLDPMLQYRLGSSQPCADCHELTK